MRLNNLSDKSFNWSNQRQNTRESFRIDEEPLPLTEIILSIPSKNFQFQQKIQQKQTNNFRKLSKLVSQSQESHQLTSIQVLGITILKIMAHQLAEHGYSRTKLNIIKSITDMQKEKTYNKYMQVFDFKTSSMELMTILNNSLKIISKSILQAGFDGKFLHRDNKVQYDLGCIKIHNIVMEHLRHFPICWQFFNKFFRMILLLVNYPTDKLLCGDIDSQEIFYIICDYLGCKISKNSQQFLIQNFHYVYLSQKITQFGIIKQSTPKKNSNQTNKKNKQSMITNDQSIPKKKSSNNLNNNQWSLLSKFNNRTNISNSTTSVLIEKNSSPNKNKESQRKSVQFSRFNQTGQMNHKYRCSMIRSPTFQRSEEFIII